MPQKVKDVKKPVGRLTVQMGVAMPPELKEDIIKLAGIKSEEYGRPVTISEIGRKVLGRWVEKQKGKYGEQF